MSAVTQRGVIRAEWIKLTTVPSTLVGYAVTLAALVVVAAVTFTLPGAEADGDAGDALVVMLVLVELLVGAIGVLAATSEYGGGTIRATLAAVPRRTPVLVAKVVVHGGLVLAACGSAAIGGLLAASVLAPEDAGSLADDAVMQGLTGGALIFSTTCALGVALGMLTRSTAISLGILFALMFLPVMVTVAPEVTAYLPGRAAQAVMIPDNPPEAELLAGAPAAATVCLWAAVAVAAAAVTLRRRDA